MVDMSQYRQASESSKATFRDAIASHQCFLPLMTIEAYATAAGIPIGVMSAQVDRGMWSTVKIGKRRLLNIAALWQQCAEREY